ncbi:response regulator [Pseudomonas citronellolis]|uniref:response regulator n=1 Tax=Pseudomonas citronellolis TaxID=53408 RepID=UPI0007183F34|nr:response regulator [Pseudomonas citronellolis]KRV65706.1 response regulator receiver protein [Pseudomonas citronellolis]KRW78194.1 response regulator receiver protein [Pseudomonas citronellolis]
MGETLPHAYRNLLDDEEIEALLEITVRPERPPTVLLVDDDPQVLAEMRELIESADLQCLTASNSAQALRRIGRDESAIDLLVTDLCMEGEGAGLELIRQLHARGTFLPIIVLSGTTRARDVVEAMRLNVLDFLLKPVEPEEFLRTLKRCL